MMNKTKFYDTCALLQIGEGAFEDDKFVISSITLKELERIKVAANKDPDIKYSARLLLRAFNEHRNWVVCIHTKDNEGLVPADYDMNDDLKILSDAIAYQAKTGEEIEFVTNDLSLKCIAYTVFNGPVTSVYEDIDTYVGYKEVCPDEDTLSKFYQEPTNNIFNLHIGEYLIIRNSDNDIIDVKKWDGEVYKYLKTAPFVSDWFGKVGPYNHDIYQQLYCDSLNTNKITMVRGPAGTGKTYLAIAYLMAQLAKNRIDKIIIFCNPVATVDSAKLGYYPGSKDEKLLDSQIGNLLMSKFGGREGVQQLMETGKLVLLPFSDIRGFDTTGMNAGVYITEAQNLSRTLMKLALQRIGDDSVCIIDGDDDSQVDMKAYEGANNGMKRVSKIFRGNDIYGEVKLVNIYRSKIAEIADSI